MKTKDPGLTDARQAREAMSALSYETKGGSKNFMHIGVDATDLAIGDQIKVNLNLGGSPGAQNQDFTYLVGVSISLLSDALLQTHTNTHIHTHQQRLRHTLWIRCVHVFS